MALKLYIEDGQAKPAVKYVDDGTPPSGYTDKDSDAVEWSLRWKQADLDYLFAKEKIKTIIEATAGVDYSTFSSLSTEEKRVAVEWLHDYILYTDFTTEVSSLDERRILIALEDVAEKDAIESRIKTIDQRVREVLDRDDAQTTFDKIAEDNLYEKFRIKCSHLIHYFDSTDDYVGTGLRDSGFTPKDGRTLTVICDELVSLGNNG